MKRLVLIGLFLFAFVRVGAADIVKDANSSVSSVAVYPDMALVERRAEVSVDKGINLIYLKSPVNPSIVDRDSVTAVVYGTGELLGVGYKQRKVFDYTREDARKMEDEIKAIEEEIDKLQARIKGIDKRRDLVNAWVEVVGEKGAKEKDALLPLPEQVGPWLDFIEKSSSDMEIRYSKLKRQLEENKRRLDLLKDKLRQINAGAGREEYVFAVRYNAHKQEKVRVVVKYAVSNVSWEPVYRLDVSRANKKARFLLQARVSQNTGEDWKDVHLSISTITPLRGISLPEPEEKNISLFYDESDKEKSLYLRVESIRSATVSHHLKSYEPYYATSDIALATSNDMGIAVEYKPQVTVTIKSDSSGQLVPLTEFSKDAEFFYYTVPDASKSVFWACSIPADNKMLGGIINVFLDNRFIGKTRFSGASAQKEIRLALGEDKGVRIKKRKIESKKDEKLFGSIDRNNIIQRYVYLIEMVNLKKEKVKLMLFDSIPVSDTDKIKVKDVKFSMEPTKKDYDNKKGVCLWEINLHPGEKKEIKEEFTVIYPKNGEVIGL